MFMNKLVSCLHYEHVGDLKKRLRALSYQGNRRLLKQELLDRLTELLQVAQLKTYWELLDDTARKVIAEVIYNTYGTFSEEQFFAKYQQRPVFYLSKSHYDGKFTLLGAFFFRGCLPDELCERFKTFVARPARAVLEGYIELPEVANMQVRNMEMAAFADIKAVLRLIDSKKLKVSEATKYPSMTAMQELAKVLYAGDFYHEPTIGYIKPFAWVMLVQAGKLAKVTNGYLKLTTAGSKALLQPPQVVLKDLWEAWCHTELLDELRRIDVIKGQTGKGKRDITDPVERRDAIHEALEAGPTNVWLEFNALSRFMLAQNLGFEVTDGDPWFLYITDQQYGSLGYKDCHDWHILQERYLLCFLFEFAATLGLIDVAYKAPYHAREDYHDLWGTEDLKFLSRYDGLLYFRVNDLGKFCLAIEEEYIPKPAAVKLQISTAGVITIDSVEVPPATIAMLEQFCRRHNSSSWMLDQESLLTALELGYELSELTQFFSQHQIKVPTNINSLIQELMAKSKQLKIKDRVILIECRTAELAQQLARDPKSCAALVEEKLLVVPEEKVTKFQELVRKLGYIINN